MIKKFVRYLHHMRSLQRMNMSLSRAAASAPLREIDPRCPATWEFSGFSQHGEDGVIDYLTRRLNQANRYFVEVGASTGIENNSTWLALARSYSGLMVDGNAESIEWCQHLLQSSNYGLRFRQMFITTDNVEELKSESRFLDPDVFSLDIDGNDYHVVKALMGVGFRPKIWVVEFNSAFGPERKVTIPYQADFQINNTPGLDLYSGCSISAWRSLMARQGYRFVTVDQCGVNAFFIDPSAFPADFVDNIQGAVFFSNRSHVRAYGADWRDHFSKIKHLALVDI